MARQFFIAPLLCAINPDTGGMECEPKVNSQQANYVSACQPSTAADPQCLVLLAGDTSGASADNQLVSLVDDNLDATIASLSPPTRNRIQNGLTSKGVPITLTDYGTVREFLTALGTWFSPGFTLESFWVVG